MPTNASCLPISPGCGRLIPHLSLSGPEQMALDKALLVQSDAEAKPPPTLRFYQWNGPWLSLGRHQRHWPDHWNALAKRGDLQMVRRPSGGSAVLHEGGLTYALIWPSPPRQRQQAYRQACKWLISSFKELGVPLQFGYHPAKGPIESNCFASSTAADLVDSQGHKRIGSAQLWRNGHLLQHGEIILNPPQKLWREVFNCDPPTPAPASIPRENLSNFLQTALRSCWPEVNWQSSQVTKDEWSTVAREAPNYQVILDPSGSSTIPPETIESTT
ncbi:MAG TPA: lipoate--protein ligase family protein [Prochlorococcus sp.]